MMQEIEEGDLFLFKTFLQIDKVTFKEKGRKLVDGIVVAYKTANGTTKFADLFGEPFSTRWHLSMRNFHDLEYIGNTSTIQSINFLDQKS